MKILMTVLLASSCFILNGCFTMHIHNSSGTPGRSAEEWHHDGIFELVEFSDPVDLSKKCSGGWTSITQEKNFLQGLVADVTYSLYSPENMAWTCNKIAKGDAKAKSAPAATTVPSASKAVPTTQEAPADSSGTTAPPGDLNPGTSGN